MKNISVLMLDNNERFLRTAETFLHDQEMISEIFSTPSESEACQIAREKKPNIILLDVLMPGQSGIDLISTFRNESPDSKIIMLSLWDMNEYRESAESAGADDYISKKTMAETLIPAIQKAA